MSRWTVAADLRGYGDSDRPPSDQSHRSYSKRAMAADQAGPMAQLGHESYAVVGHDRGARSAPSSTSGRARERLSMRKRSRSTSAASTRPRSTPAPRTTAPARPSTWSTTTRAGTRAIASAVRRWSSGAKRVWSAPSTTCSRSGGSTPPTPSSCGVTPCPARTSCPRKRRPRRSRPCVDSSTELSGRLSSLASGAVADPGRGLLAGAAGGREELGFAVVGVESDLPGGVVDDAVVFAAEQDEVVE